MNNENITQSTLCLNMIVKNESGVIAETLENLYQHFPISTFVICDTGSTDNTVEIIETFFKEKGIQGEVLHHQWKNFEHNRNLALEACVGKSDYILIFDADDLVQGKLELPNPMTANSYYFNFVRDGLQFMRKAIVKNDRLHYWKGVVHELLHYRGENDSGQLIVGDYIILSRSIGGRSKDPNTWINDAKMIEEAYYQENSDFASRYAFYCAQSYFSAKAWDQAVKWYEIRISHHEKGEGWDQEAYQSCLMLAEIYRTHLVDDKNQLYYLHKALQINDKRAEAWYWLAHFYSKRNQPDIAYYFAQDAVAHTERDVNQSLLNNDIYDWACDYEVCVNGFKIGKIEASYQAFKKLLDKDGLVVMLHSHLHQYLPLISAESTEESERIFTRLCNLGLISKSE